MTAGIRAELAIRGASSCPLTDLPNDATGRSLSWGETADGTMTEDIEIDGDVALGEEFKRVFAYGDRDVYRFSHDADGCPCKQIESLGSPVIDAYARDGALNVVVHVPDVDGLRDIVGDVEESFETVTVQRLVQAEGSAEQSHDQDLVFVDRSRLTARQREVLETAHEMGYFDHPRGANAGEVAEELDISRATFVEHLTTAQSKLFAALVDD